MFPMPVRCVVLGKRSIAVGKDWCRRLWYTLLGQTTLDAILLPKFNDECGFGINVAFSVTLARGGGSLIDVRFSTRITRALLIEEGGVESVAKITLELSIIPGEIISGVREVHLMCVVFSQTRTGYGGRVREISIQLSPSFHEECRSLCKVGTQFSGISG